MRKTLTEEELSVILKTSIIIRGAVIMTDYKDPDRFRNMEAKIRRVIFDGSGETFDEEESQVAIELIYAGVKSQILEALQVVQDPERDRNTRCSFYITRPTSAKASSAHSSK